jgi:AcrR family transcriptional regulator
VVVASRDLSEPAGRRRSPSRTAATSDDTRLRILEATLATIRDEGIVGASARAIARAGKFNQASIYYHFGSINDAVVAAIAHMSAEQLARYQAQLVTVQTLPELVTVARSLHEEDSTNGTLRILAQVMAGSAADESFAASVADVFDPWIDVVTAALRRVLGQSPLGASLPVDDLAYAVSALFVGIEVLASLRPGDPRSHSLFTTFNGMASLIELMLRLATGPDVDTGAATPPSTPAG